MTKEQRRTLCMRAARPRWYEVDSARLRLRWLLSRLKHMMVGTMCDIKEVSLKFDNWYCQRHNGPGSWLVGCFCTYHNLYEKKRKCLSRLSRKPSGTGYHIQWHRRHQHHEEHQYQHPGGNQGSVVTRPHNPDISAPPSQPACEGSRAIRPSLYFRDQISRSGYHDITFVTIF